MWYVGAKRAGHPLNPSKSAFKEVLIRDFYWILNNLLPVFRMYFLTAFPILPVRPQLYAPALRSSRCYGRWKGGWFFCHFEVLSHVNIVASMVFSGVSVSGVGVELGSDHAQRLIMELGSDHAQRLIILYLC